MARSQRAIRAPSSGSYQVSPASTTSQPSSEPIGSVSISPIPAWLRSALSRQASSAKRRYIDRTHGFGAGQRGSDRHDPTTGADIDHTQPTHGRRTIEEIA